MSNRLIHSLKRANKVSLLMLMYFLSLRGFTQSVNYSQYSDAPFYTNPAMVASKSEMKFLVSHRSQPLTDLIKYNTSSLTLIKPLMADFNTRRWGGLGVSLVNDELKGALDFRTQGISAAYAYNLALSSDQYLSFGMQAGYFQRNISLGNYTTSSQWDQSIGYIPGRATGEIINEGRKNYLSLSTGFLYYLEDENSQHKATFGISAFNVNRPNISYTEQKDLIPVKFISHASLVMLQKGNLYLNGEMLYYRENNKNTYHPGARISYLFKNNNPFDPLQDGRIDFKAGYRVNNAVTTELQLHQPNFSIGFAYDFGVASEQSYRNPNDVIEIQFTLRKIIGVKKKKPIKKSKRPEKYSSLNEVREFYFNDPQESETTGEEEADNRSDTIHIPEEGFKLKHDFKFGFNEAKLNEESKLYLDDLVELLNKNDSIRLDVIGHTDNVGSNVANRNVSMKRAQVVIDYLKEKGIAPERLTGIPIGAREPLVPNTTQENRALNRRVEFILYK